MPASLSTLCICLFFFNDTATPEIYTLSLHDALPISPDRQSRHATGHRGARYRRRDLHDQARSEEHTSELQSLAHLVCRLRLEKKKTIPQPSLRSSKNTKKPKTTKTK